MYNQKRIKMYIYSYRPEDLIGSGYNSQVFKGQNDVNGDIVAIKVCDHSRGCSIKQKNSYFYKKSQHDKSQIYLTLLKCIFTVIIHILHILCDLENMIMKRGYTPENQAILIFYQILTGLKDQISKGVIHADLKPSNILIQKGIYKIANYGHSRMIYSQNQQVQYNVSTTLYNQTKTSVKNDIWNLGVLFYKILTGKLPWQVDREQEFVKFPQKSYSIFRQHNNFISNQRSYQQMFIIR